MTTHTSTNPFATQSAARQITVDHTDGSPLAPDDPRGAMERAVQVARAIIAEVTPDNASRPSPCSEWNAGQVAQHIVAVLDRAAAGPTDVVIDSLPILAEVGIDGLSDAAEASARQVHANWNNDEAMAAMIDVPWGTFPGAVVIGVYAGETLVHAWDLSVAIGVHVNWPDADAAIGFEMSKQGIPESPRDEHMPFDPVVRPGEGAPMIEHLVGWQGRDVERWRV